MKQEINMIGGGFQHAPSSCGWSIPKHVEWIKGARTAPISIHIDYTIKEPVDNSKKNYAWLSEFKTINRGLYEWCAENVEYLEDNFEYLFTHDDSLLELSDRFKSAITNCVPWVKDCNIHKKSKLASMVASSKVMCDEHRYRQEIIRKYTHQLDHYGSGFNHIETKEEGLNDYHFSVTMENATYQTAFSEKLTDCFATGTIPIWWGPDVSHIFDGDGIIKLTDNFKVSDLTPELYHSKMEAIKNNYEITMRFPIAGDFIYLNYIK